MNWLEFETLVDKQTPEFSAAYRRRAGSGAADQFSGRESQRVYREWQEAGQPEDIEDFLRKQANAAPPTGTEE